MNIWNVWANREMPTGRWCRSLYCKSWHERLRFWLVKLLLRSFGKSQVCYTRVDTGSGDTIEEIPLSMELG